MLLNSILKILNIILILYAKFYIIVTIFFNEALYILRQNFFINKTKNKKDRIYIRYYDLYHLLKDSENFKFLQASVAQQIIKITYDTFNSFIKSI